MPRPVPAWVQALQSVDLSNPARPRDKIWGMWFPEPGLLLGPQTEERRDRYFFAWLRIRPAWLYLLRHPGACVTAVPTQWWRDVLNTSHEQAQGGDTARAKRWLKIRHLFGEVFSEVDWNDQGAYARWHNFYIQGFEHKLGPAILWELAELAFHHEILALDRFLVPNRDSPGYEVTRDDLIGRVFLDGNVYAITHLPREASGLAHPFAFRRAAKLEALRCVVRRWPGCSPDLVRERITHQMPESDILAMENLLAEFYVASFFQYSGRAPMIPYIPPPLVATDAVYNTDDTDGSDFDL